MVAHACNSSIRKVSKRITCVWGHIVRPYLWNTKEGTFGFDTWNLSKDGPVRTNGNFTLQPRMSIRCDWKLPLWIRLRWWPLHRRYSGRWRWRWITDCCFRSLLFIPVDSGISVVSCVNVFPSKPDCSDWVCVHNSVVPTGIEVFRKTVPWNS